MPAVSLAQPKPGDVFREYRWRPDTTDAGGALRVGGREGYGGGAILLPHDVDVQHALNAEVVIEKLLCHDGTRGLAIQVNDHDWRTVPEAEGIPAPQCDYQHHTCAVVAVPLGDLHAGKGNGFRLRVSPEHPWKWPQNLIYGVHFRIYYDPLKKPHPSGRMTSPKPGEALGQSVQLRASASSPHGRIQQVDFLGLYEDANWEGDGRYRQWHYRSRRAALTGHLGTAVTEPYQVVWDTSWVPDQRQPIRLAAWVVDETGLTCFTEAAGEWKLLRPGHAVELCKPYDVPKKWVTRSGEKEQKFQVAGDLGKAVAARLLWSSWSPGYMNGIYVNSKKVFGREGPRYACFTHCVPLDVRALVSGENVLRTGATPKYDGKTVHGMEVNWPGIMVLIQYRDSGR